MAEEIEKERGVVMDTPERTKIATPLSKFEDSPVFNYINSLSPIKPVKSIYVTQSYTSLGFASVPSVFTSPHVSSVKESRFLRRNQLSDPSKPGLTCENSKSISEGISNVTRNPSYECSNSEAELSRTLSYEVVSPDTKNAPQLAGPSSSIVRFIQDTSTNDPSRNETEIKERDSIEQKQGSGCDWDNLISDASELLNFDSFGDEMPYKSPDQNMIDTTSIMIDNHKPEDADVLGSTAPSESGNLSEKGENLKEAAEEILATTYFNNPVNGDPIENIENEVGSNLCRGMRRRCLLFEMAGSRRKHLEDGSPIVSESNASDEKRVNNSSRCVLPGIGLHLNALAATTSLDHKVIKHEALGNGNGGQLIIAPSMASAQESLKKVCGTSSLEENVAPAQNGVPVSEDASKQLGFLANDDLNQSSPRKKRRRGEHGGESEACKRCNCKKSKCLKLYCECFAAGVYCVEPCSCQDCFNKPIHEDTVLATRKQIESRNPLAFAPKVIRTSEPILETGDESSKTPASARHKRGCNCKKSGCLKKYCECYQGGVGCSVNCRCEGCKNAFGRKDGSEMDVEVNDEDECEGNKIVGKLQKNAAPIEAEPVSATPATPSRFGRQPIPLPMTSKNKPPRSFLPIGISNFQAPGKHEIPEILQSNNGSSSSSFTSGVKSSSPNSKRVSPPHSSSPVGPKSTRKLILQSIPSFPSLTTHP